MSTLPNSTETISACRALFLERLGALLQDSGVLSGPAIQVVLGGVSTYFDEIIASSRRGSFQEEVDGLTSSRLTLVGEDDLELEIRFDNLSAKLFQETGNELWKIHLRFVTLLNRADLAKTHNPVGPNGIVRGLEEMFAAASPASIDKKLDTLDRIEAKLQLSLPLLYTEINDFLAGQGVEAVQPAIINRPDGPRKDPGAATMATEGTLLALQQTLLSRLPAMAQPLASGEGGGAVSSLLTQATLERLIFRLDELDRQGGYAPAVKVGTSPNLETLIPGLFSEEEARPSSKPKSLNSAELGISALAPEGLAIDTLAMIFETIFDHPTLPDALKAVISSLQITMLKLAMQDAAFFSDAAHPARLLFDRMGQVMLGLPVDVPARHPLCKALFEIAGQLRSQFSGDMVVFNTALSRVDALMAEQSVRVASVAEPYMPLVEQVAQRDQSAGESRLALDKLIAQGLPAPIQEFIDNTWRQVLQLVLSEYGPNSREWQEYNQVINDLLWTFQPKAVADDRKALAKRLPEILKLLKAGMERVNMPIEAQAAFLDVSFALQTQALRTTQIAVENTVSAGREGIDASGLQLNRGEVLAGELRSGELVLRTLGFAHGQPAPVRSLPCQVGDWLEIRLIDGESAVARLCHLTAGSQWALLCNPDAGLVLAVHTAILDKQFREGVAHVCSATSLFDAAAEWALRRTTKI